MRKIVTQPSAIIVYISAICVFLVPFLFRIVGASSVFRLVISFFVINLILAWAIGRMMRKYQLRWWVSLIMPILLRSMFGFNMRLIITGWCPSI
ncbi:hypothetical protein [Lacticaseibacillus saniviri]|uniref:hypothetical protein n=1 Tax=Lacticaseibacillus saniviri TaxID=931533 RepID=UPI0006D03739|nr:hypothetical protein [Lacticaseibacillus saniviri]